MDDIYYDKVLNRIIQGRLRLRLGDLVLFVYEPDLYLKEQGFEIYEAAKEKAYLKGSFVEQEALEILLKYDMWSPFDDQEATELEKQLEELKIQAFRNFFKSKMLFGIKRNIRKTENKIAELRSKKTQFEALTCEGVGRFAMRSFLIEHTTKTLDGNDYNFNPYSVSFIMNQYSQNAVTPATFRKIARSGMWRSIWNGSKKRDTVFDKPPCEWDQFQASLVSYSMMYDNVYESPDSPKDEIIEDDDCLDGWFIVQRRKHEKDKKQKEVDGMLTNEKIANSQEVFLVAQDHQEASEIYGLNNDHMRQTIRNRQDQVHSHDGNLHFKDLNDVQQDRMMNAVNAGRDRIKGRR